MFCTPVLNLPKYLTRFQPNSMEVYWWCGVHIPVDHLDFLRLLQSHFPSIMLDSLILWRYRVYIFQHLYTLISNKSKTFSHKNQTYVFCKVYVLSTYLILCVMNLTHACLRTSKTISWVFCIFEHWLQTTVFKYN